MRKQQTHREKNLADTKTEYNIHQKVSIWMRATIEADSLDDAVRAAVAGEGDDWTYLYETLDTNEFPEDLAVEPIVADTSEVNARVLARDHGLDQANNRR